MEIIQVKKDKKKYLDLLLLADEQEDMVDRYLERGDMFVLTDGTVRAECVVTKEGPGIYELKNIATAPQFHRQGYGRRLIEYIFTYYPDLKTLYVGTGDSPLSLAFTMPAVSKIPTGWSTSLPTITTIPSLRTESSWWTWSI